MRCASGQLRSPILDPEWCKLLDAYKQARLSWKYHECSKISAEILGVDERGYCDLYLKRYELYPVPQDPPYCNVAFNLAI
jgi:hypothetical protein